MLHLIHSTTRNHHAAGVRGVYARHICAAYVRGMCAVTYVHGDHAAYVRTGA